MKGMIPTSLNNLLNKLFKKEMQVPEDPVGDMFSTLAIGTLNIQPASGYEWIVHNIFHGTDATLSWVNSGNTIIFDTDLGSGLWAKYAFHMKNTDYIKVTSAGTISADGIVSKVP